MKKRLLISIMFILVLSTYSIKMILNLIIINIEELVIENNVHVKRKKLKKNYLFYMKQIFF